MENKQTKKYHDELFKLQILVQDQPDGKMQIPNMNSSHDLFSTRP